MSSLKRHRSEKDSIMISECLTCENLLLADCCCRSRLSSAPGP